MSSFRHILLATDFGEASQRAVEFGLTLAGRLDAALTLIHACRVVVQTYEGLYPTADLINMITDAARQQLDVALAAARKTLPAADAILRYGPPWQEILSTIDATRADLVVLGTHGRIGIARAVLGSVAERVVRLSPVPTIVVP